MRSARTKEWCAEIGKEGAQAAWDALKDELKARNLSLATGPAACYRTKVGCMRICAGGPILVVYPEGTWYGGMTADRIPRFVQEHLIDGKPIEEWIFARNPLPSEYESHHKGTKITQRAQRRPTTVQKPEGSRTRRRQRTDRFRAPVFVPFVFCLSLSELCSLLSSLCPLRLCG